MVVIVYHWTEGASVSSQYSFFDAVYADLVGKYGPPSVAHCAFRSAKADA